MKVSQLLKLNPVDELRFYEYSDTMVPSFIDEYTPYKSSDEVDLNREVEYFCVTIEVPLGEYENDWVSVILKEKENA